MKKPVFGGLVSSLVFAFGCNESPGTANDNAQATPDDTSDRAPQVLFDPDTGRMTIVSSELSDAVRATLGIPDQQSTIVFRAPLNDGENRLAMLQGDPDEDINLRC